MLCLTEVQDKTHHDASQGEYHDDYIPAFYYKTSIISSFKHLDGVVTTVFSPTLYQDYPDRIVKAQGKQLDQQQSLDCLARAPQQVQAFQGQVSGQEGGALGHVRPRGGRADVRRLLNQLCRGLIPYENLQTVTYSC